MGMTAAEIKKRSLDFHKKWKAGEKLKGNLANAAAIDAIIDAIRAVPASRQAAKPRRKIPVENPTNARAMEP